MMNVIQIIRQYVSSVILIYKLKSLIVKVGLNIHKFAT